MADDARRTPRRGRAWAGGAGRAVASLGTIQPAPEPRWPIALQAAVSMATPVAVGVAAGHHEVGLLASSGAFTCLYVGWRRSVERVKVLPIVALALTASAALGALTGPSPVATAFGLVAVTLAAAAASFAWSLGPPGALFPVLVYGLCAHVSVIDGGERVQEPGVVVGAIAAGSAFACLVAASALIRPSHRRPSGAPLRDILPGPSWDGAAPELMLRVAIVAVVGTAASMLAVDPERAYWVVGAGVAVIGSRPGRGAAASRGLHRIVGTFVGALLYLAVGAWVELPVAALIAILGGLQFLAQLMVVRHYAIALAFITPTVLMLANAAAGSAPTVPVVAERVIDTVVGGALGALTGLVHRPRA